jgi:DNA-binding transcriptional MerR regulator
MSNHQDRSARLEAEAAGDRAGRDQVLSIENVAKMFGVSRWTLHYYGWRGLIERRLWHGQLRVYSWADCERLSVIIKCRKAGVALRDVVAIMAASDEDAPASVARAGQEQCMVQIDRLEVRRRVQEEALAELTHIYALLAAKGIGPHPPRRD